MPLEKDEAAGFTPDRLRTRTSPAPTTTSSQPSLQENEVPLEKDEVESFEEEWKTIVRAGVKPDKLRPPTGPVAASTSSPQAKPKAARRRKPKNLGTLQAVTRI